MSELGVTEFPPRTGMLPVWEAHCARAIFRAYSYYGTISRYRARVMQEEGLET